jgi:demethoxyubiquinone hydroxylase (CLK1/Coq7/Cat5 family)
LHELGLERECFESKVQEHTELRAAFDGISSTNRALSVKLEVSATALREEESLSYKLNQDMQRLKDLDVTRQLDITALKHRYEALKTDLSHIEADEASHKEAAAAFESHLQTVCGDLHQCTSAIGRVKQEVQ